MARPVGYPSPIMPPSSSYRPAPGSPGRIIAALAFLLVAVPRIALADPGDAEGAGASQSGSSSASGTQQTKTTAELLSDLGGEDGPNRLYAARALKAELRRSLSVVQHAQPGSMAGDEALSTLDEMGARLPEQCIVALKYPNVVAPAAEMLALLGDREAIPAVKDALAKETRKGVARRLQTAETALENAPVTDPSAPVGTPPPPNP